MIILLLVGNSSKMTPTKVLPSKDIKEIRNIKYLHVQHQIQHLKIRNLDRINIKMMTVDTNCQYHKVPLQAIVTNHNN